jgi:hypothetical protein
MKLAPTAFAFLLIALGSPHALGADFTVEKTPTGGVLVQVDGKAFTEFVVDQANKTYLWPIHGPTGKVMTRRYPMETVEGEQHDHPHHRGLCFGHQDIGGFNNWAEAASYGKPAAGKPNPKSDAQRSKLGSIKHREYRELKGGETGVISAVADYLTNDGKKYMEEERVMTFRVKDDTRIIDVDITLHASEGDVEVGDEKDAGLSIRVPTEMAVEIEKGKKGSGHIINSKGDKDADAWAKRAPWCDYYGTVEGEALGVAMLNHPSSFRHPTPWHVRTYGLFTANPFGLKALNKDSESGAMTLKKGEKLTLRHRFIFHKGDEKEGKIAEAYAAYAKEK